MLFWLQTKMKNNRISERLAKKEDIENNLRKEFSGLSTLKETLQKSNQLTKSMTGILTSFEERLAKLEETILPVYNDTSTLQRRQENIEKTLGALDNVINYYNVTSEVEQTIKEGPIGTLEEYMETLACVQRAIDYFKKNNPDSPELLHLATLFELGGSALEKEFRILLNRYCKPTPPVLIMDMIGTGDDELTGEDNRTVLEQLPEKGMQELTCIANWLVENNRVDYMNVYATIRSNILLRSIQGWKDFQKSSSGGGSGTGVGGSSSTPGSTAALSSPALSRARYKDTPTRKTSKRFQQVLMKKATSTVMKYSQSVEQATGFPLGHRRQGSLFDLKDENIDLDVEYYLMSITALHKLMQCELQLMENIIPRCHWKDIFERVFQASLDMIIQEGENIASKAKKSADKHDFSSTLIVFPILKHLITMRPEFENILKECQNTVRLKLDALISILYATGGKALDDFIDNIKNDVDRQMPKDGTVHELTSNAIIFLEQSKDYVDTVGSMLVLDPSYQTHLASVKEGDRKIVAFAVYIFRVLSILGLTLINKSDWYSDPHLKAVFRLNNLHYILKSLQRSGITEITKLYNKDLEDHYNDQILDQKRIYSQSWSRVLHYVLEVDRPLAPGNNHGGKLKDKDRQSIKDKFTGFNKEMEDIYKIQKGYAIPDIELRESLKQDNKHFILPKYEQFYNKYINMPFTKHKEKYIRYTPVAVNDMMDRFFDVAA